MILGIVFALLTLFMAASTFAKAFVLWALVRHGGIAREEKPVRYWGRVVFQIADCVLGMFVVWVGANASLSNFGLIGPWSFPSLQN